MRRSSGRGRKKNFTKIQEDLGQMPVVVQRGEAQRIAQQSSGDDNLARLEHRSTRVQTATDGHGAT